jgi:tetratricopeptide (TPR) repeat protein
MESALFASLAVMLVYFIVRTLIPNPYSLIPSIVASLILAFSATFWEQAVIAEKYTLNAFFFTLLIFILLKWQASIRNPQSAIRNLYLFSFLLGLSFTHHFQTIYIVPGSVFFILTVSWKNRKRYKPQVIKKRKSIVSILILQLKSLLLRIITLPSRAGLPIFLILKAFFLFILPLTLWSYLPLRANQNPILNWGNPSNLENFVIHITGQTYGVYFSAIKESFNRISSHLSFFPSQFSWCILWLGLLAIPILLWKKTTFFLFFALIFITNTIHSIRYTIVNIQDYYIPSFILLAILIGFGLSFIRLIRLKTIFFLFLLLPFIPYQTHHFQNNREKFYFAYDYGMNILKPLKKNAIIFPYGDATTFPLWYLLYGENRRQDISFLTWILLSCDWHIEAVAKNHNHHSFHFDKIAVNDLRYHNLNGVIVERSKRIITDNFGRFPIYVGPGMDQKDYLLFSDGVFFRLLPKETKGDRLSKELENSKPHFFLRGINDNSIFKDRIVNSELITNYPSSFNSRGNLYRTINLAKAISEYKTALTINPSYMPAQLNLAFAYVDTKNYDKAISLFRNIAKKDPNYEPSLVHYGFGLVYQNKSMIKEAIKEYNAALEIDPNNTYAKQKLEEMQKISLDKN